MNTDNALPDAGIERAAALLSDRRTVVLSGAGISTPSGIPDYRGPDYRQRRRAPVDYREFVNGTHARQRYWARSAVGWEWFRRRTANEAHRAVADLERRNIVCGVITQNVDGLHQAAGSRHVIDLHGRLSRVICLECGNVEHRDSLQQRMLEANPGWDDIVAEPAPDGDADLSDQAIAAFTVPECLRCGGVLKPDVVFFGENVPRERVQESFEMLSGAGLLMVLGSSLAVFSGLRFVLHAVEHRIDILIVNRGKTRGDRHATLRIDGALEEVVPKVASMV